ncbi:MAG: glycosyl transferase family 2 [Zetaproteobacteria bacterium]|nr:MAG: glycosyl transferase family 2 [Zetaproteobacteria bacterium]
MPDVSVVMITKNAERKLELCLASLSNFSEVIIYDNGSTDNTLEIAKKFSNVKVFEGQFFGFGETKRHASSLASNGWIFSLDADEVLSENLVKELRSLSLDEDTCYQVRRDNYYRGKHIKCCGWYPEYIVRLYHREQTNFSDAKVHESIETKGLKVEKLKAPIEHYSFDSVSDFLVKIQIYSEIYANDMQGKKHVSVLAGVGRGLFAFIKSYFFRKGIFWGFEGLVIAFFHGLGTTVKYLKLHEKNNPKS